MRRVARVVATLAVLLAVLAGCGEPEATVTTIRGEITAPDTAVIVAVPDDDGDPPSPTRELLDCLRPLADRERFACEATFAPADEFGAFSLNLPLGTQQGALVVAGLVPQLPGEALGPMVASLLLVQPDGDPLPPVEVPRPLLGMVLDGDDVLIGTDLVAEDDRVIGQPVLEVFAVRGTAWQVPAAERTSFDLRVLEDLVGDVSVLASMRVGPPVLEQLLRSSLVPFDSGAGPAYSRGQVCRPNFGSQVGEPLSPCPLTDGDLVEAVPLGAGCPTCPEYNSVDVLLPAVVTTDLIVVRGCEQTCTLEASEDGTTFRSIGTTDGRWSAVHLDPPQALSTLRVGQVGGLPPISEVSIWATGPAERRVLDQRFVEIAEAARAEGYTPPPSSFPTPPLAAGADAVEDEQAVRLYALALLAIALTLAGLAAASTMQPREQDVAAEDGPR